MIIAAGISSIGAVFCKYYFAENSCETPPKLKTYVILAAAMTVISGVYAYLAWYAGLDYYTCQRYSVLMCALPFIALIDRKMLIIPNRAIIGLLLFRVALVIPDIITAGTQAWRIWAANALAVFIGTLIMAAPRIFVKNGVGAGDIKCVAAVGLFYEFSAMFGFLFWSILLSCLYGIFLMVVKKKSRDTQMAFAPFFAIGAIIGPFMEIVSVVLSRG
jgi:leader peptidase (prepilin peptidase)/N-methyltransferase